MGKFIGTVKTEWLGDGRDMELLSNLEYIDDNGKSWTAITGDIVNGASIPFPLWGILFGSPYIGRFRTAAVIHDVYCGRKTRSWQSVHKCFDEMMYYSGVPTWRRFLMAKAVWVFGPRWKENRKGIFE